MIVGVEDGLRWVGLGQAPRGGLAVNVVAGAAVDGEMGRLVDERSGLGISTGIWGIPEGTAEVDRPELVRIWSRDESVPNNNITIQGGRTDVGVSAGIGAGAVVGEGRVLAAAD